MNGENGRNVEKRRCKCLLLGIIFYLYANVAVVAIVLDGVDAADAMAAEPADQQQQHQHAELRQPRVQSGSGSGGGGGRGGDGGEIPLVRLPSNTLLKYTAYKDVSILHFHIPTDTRTANFNFKAYEETKSAFQRQCKPRDVTLHLKAGSYPVISPENITFPKHFLHADQRFEIYNLQFKSDGTMRRLSIDGPHTGDWFAVAFISWTDPKIDRIEQQGLAASCETLLLSEMSVVRTTPIILNGGNTGLMHNNTLTGLVATDGRIVKNNSNVTSSSSTSNTKTQTANPESINYKFFVDRYVDVVALHFNIWHICAECPAIALHVQANALPTPKRFIHRHIIYANKTGETIMEFYPQQSAWHFIEIMFATTGTSSMAGDDTGNATTPKPAFKSKAKIEKKQFSTEAKNVSVQFGIALDFTNERITHDLLRDDAVASVTNTSGENANSTSAMDLVDATNNSSPSASSSMPDTAFGYDEREMNDDYANDGEDGNSDDSDKEKSPRGIKYYALLRQTYREFFMFDYDLLPNDNGTVPTFINLTAGTPTGFRFQLGNVYDIGGTLSFAVVMKDNLKDAAAAVGASASASLIKPRNHISSDTAVAEKLVHVNTGDGSMNYELDHLNVNDAEEINGYAGNDDAPGRSNQTIIICMRLGEPGIPTWPDKCVYGRHILPAASIVNNTNDETSTGLIHVPFPESGMWYVTLGLYCHGAETAARFTIIDSVKEFIKKYVDFLHDMRGPCACANRTAYYQKCIGDHHCLDALNESETLKVKECLMDSKCTSRHQEMAHKFELHHKFATEQSVATGGSCNASAVFTVSSSPCVAGRCGRYGRCYHYMSGGFVFSTCLCIKGYRGWDCTEDSQVPSSLSILIALLLLTLSNLLFIPSIYFAVRRKYYTEGIIYFFAMFFSIFYHACDSGEDEYSFCLVKIGVLQFCDFYCGLLAIWVTLIAMAHIRDTFVSMLHMFGAIVLAFGTELNKQSLWVFLAPALTGLCLISVSWGWRCQRTRKWFPARKYLSIFLPTGMVLVMIGLVCYAFLQTRQNYHIVHSVWHMLMALSILCLLPSRKSFLPKC